MSSYNGIDYFPEEFMPDKNKSKKNNNESMQQSAKLDKQIMLTALQSEINVED